MISTETELGTKNALLDDLCPTVDNCLPTFFEDEEDMGKPPTLTERMENVEAALKRPGAPHLAFEMWDLGVTQPSQETAAPSQFPRLPTLSESASGFL